MPHQFFGLLGGEGLRHPAPLADAIVGHLQDWVFRGPSTVKAELEKCAENAALVIERLHAGPAGFQERHESRHGDFRDSLAFEMLLQPLKVPCDAFELGITNVLLVELVLLRGDVIRERR